MSFIPVFADPVLALLAYSDADYTDADPNWQKINADCILIR